MEPCYMSDLVKLGEAAFSLMFVVAVLVFLYKMSRD